MAAALNLSNEVVKMRAEVKRVKVLIIRKLTRQMVALKKKKGSEANVERNRRRAERLLNEIHELKALAPDSVTKAALLSDISFEKVCQNKESCLAERATARIATHPEFSKRIQSIKNAIEAFKAERISTEKKEQNSIDTEEEETESELDSIQEERSDEEEGNNDNIADDNDNADDNDDNKGSSIKVQKADKELLKHPAEQNKGPVTAKEGSSGASSTPAEIMRMRKEVKKLRVLIIRTLTQQITALKKTKSEVSEELKGNMECVERLQKEVHVLRTLLPDHVTIRALKGDIDAEKLFRDPESNAVERATARIATHERFLKKLEDVRQAIEKEKATKDGEVSKDVSEMMKALDGDGETENEKVEEVAVDDSENDDSEEDDEVENYEEKDDDDDDNKEEEVDDNEKHVKENKEIKEEIRLNETTSPFNVVPRPSIKNLPEETRLSSANIKSKSIQIEKATRTPANQESTSKPVVKVTQSRPTKDKEAVPPPLPPIKPISESDTKNPETRNDPEESDLSDSEEEKEYFDDSTEERFRKQSSYSEQSDDDDDFFLGKVSKLKKKKNDTAPRPEKIHTNKSQENDVKEMQEFKMRSVFCSTLSKSSIFSQKGKHANPKQLSFRDQRHNQKQPWLKNQGAGSERKPPGFKGQGPGSREGGDKTTKPVFDRKNAPFHKAGKHSQQALHPSWEASRKRKEQQAQISAFQGKKIKFDDDDDD